jgi:hypothetical protein
MSVGEGEAGVRPNRTEPPNLTHFGDLRILKKIDVRGTNYENNEELFVLQKFPGRLAYPSRFRTCRARRSSSVAARLQRVTAGA